MGKSSKPTIGYWYRVAYHHGLTIGPIDAFLEFRGGDKTAWKGAVTASTTISVSAPNLWGGEKDQGGIVGELAVMFGEPTQLPNAYLVSVFGNQTAAWRGFATVAFQGGRYGAMNPYPQPASYKIRRILQGWDGGTAWYPEKGEILLGKGVPSAFPGWRYLVVPYADTTDYSSPTFDDSSWSTGASPFGNAYNANAAAAGFLPTPATVIALENRVWLRTSIDLAEVPDTFEFESFVDNGIKCWINGTLAVDFSTPIGTTCTVSLPGSLFVAGTNNIAVMGYDDLNGAPPGDAFYFDLRLVNQGISLIGANPAHVLYESLTNSEMGREPVENINDASFRASADKLYDEGFGICPMWDPGSESLEDFQQRICRLIGGSMSRSPEDGQWYLDLARGDYVLADLPILTDDDILDFKEQPSTFDSAINSVSVRYFDPEKKETIVTAPVRALGLVTAFGTIHQTYDYPEIATADLATRVALRELLTTTTPTRAFDQVTTRRTYAWRPDQYFRLQAPKRGIADMVCLVGEKQSGSLKSGAIKLKATEDIYSLPATSFVEVEPGVDPRPSQTPNAITLERAIEAPYVEVAASMARADLDALSADAGFVMAVAAAPATEIDFTLMVDAGGGGYAKAGDGEWCATATVNEAAGKGDTSFTLANGKRLDQVTVGMGVLWDGEIGRVDAIDATAGSITLARACADTVPVQHAADSRLWFYPVGFAFDATEYADGEAIDVKLLSNTGSQQLPLASATAMALTFDQRLARPYPPGNVQVAGSAWPATVSGSFAVSWAHRDRIQQADQLVDTTASSIGPESTVRYGLRFEDAGTASLIVERTDLGGPSVTAQLGASAPASVRMKLWAISDNGASWQTHEHVFSYSGGSGSPSIDGVDYIPPPDATIVDGNDPPPPSTAASGPEVLDGGQATTGTPLTLTIGATVIDPCASPYNASPSASAAANSVAFNSAFAALPVGGGTVQPSIAGDYTIDTANSIKPVSHSRLRLPAGCRLVAAGTTHVTAPGDHRNVIDVDSVIHVEIQVARLTGYRAFWAANGGAAVFGASEWAHGLFITNSSMVNVQPSTFVDCVGDAISIGRSSHDIWIGGLVTRNNRRQGISNGGDDVTTEDCDIGYIGGSDGTAPMAGIDNEVDNPGTYASTGMIVRRVKCHHNSGPGLILYKSANNVTVEDFVSEYNTKGIYAVDSDNVTISGATKLRYNRYEGMHLRGTCSSWSVRADFFDNKTKQYGAPSGSTTMSPSSTLKAKNVTVESTVTGLTYDPSTTWGAV